jgi:hypothetical protein
MNSVDETAQADRRLAYFTLAGVQLADRIPNVHERGARAMARLDEAAIWRNLNEIITALANSAESQALYGAVNTSSISNVVDSIYMALFNRPGEAEGRAYYVDGFKTGRFTAATIALDVVNGARGQDGVGRP